jgi:hypothetical protein
VANTPVIIGITAHAGTTELPVSGVTVQSQPLAMSIDPQKGQPGGFDWISNTPYIPLQPGIYTVSATAQSAVGPAISASYSFRVLAAGGSQSDPLPDDPPAVITAKTIPRADLTGVPIAIFPQVTFTEPVRNLVNQVTLVEADTGTPVLIRLSGVCPSGPVTEITDASVVVTSLTLQPRVGLKYGTRYRLTLGVGITDLDPAPKTLETAYTTGFATFDPVSIGGTEETFSTRGMVILERSGLFG